MWGCGYCVQSCKCHVRYNSRSLRDARCALPRLSRARSAAVTWITRCISLTFDEFERVMRAVEKGFQNTKRVAIKQGRGQKCLIGWANIKPGGQGACKKWGGGAWRGYSPIRNVLSPGTAPPRISKWLSCFKWRFHSQNWKIHIKNIKKVPNMWPIYKQLILWGRGQATQASNAQTLPRWRTSVNSL